MAVIALVRPTPECAAAIPALGNAGEARIRLRRYGHILKYCFASVLVLWVALQILCLLALFRHTGAGIVAGTINGSLAFKLWYPPGYLAPPLHNLTATFLPCDFPWRSAVAFSLLLLASGLPFTIALCCLCHLFDLYAQETVFAERNTIVMRRLGHAIMATGYSPLLFGPIAHVIGMIRPITDVTVGMVVAVLLGAFLLAIARVVEIGQQIQLDQEDIL